MPGVDVLWTTSRGEIEDGSTRILLWGNMKLIQINKCRFDCARVPDKKENDPDASIKTTANFTPVDAPVECLLFRKSNLALPRGIEPLFQP